jgi:hypothetical protein
VILYDKWRAGKGEFVDFAVFIAALSGIIKTDKKDYYKAVDKSALLVHIISEFTRLSTR